MKGYVYILTNEFMPGLVKIGRTSGDPEARAAQLYQTGVPTPFEVSYSVATPDCVHLELVMHEVLADVRVSDSREFFRCCKNEAANKLDIHHAEHLLTWLDEFAPDHVIAHSELVLDEGDLHFAAAELGASFYDVAAAMQEIRPEELRPALDRWERRKESARAERLARKSEPVEGEALH